MAAVDISTVLEPELLQKIPFGTQQKINELVSVLEKQSEERISEVERVGEEKLRAIKQQLDNTTRKLLETEMHLVKLRAESHTGSRTAPDASEDARPAAEASGDGDTRTGQPGIIDCNDDWTNSVKDFANQIGELKRALKGAENLSFGEAAGNEEGIERPGVVGHLREALSRLEDVHHSMASRFQQLMNKQLALSRAIEEYQLFIYEKEKECYTLQTTNNDLAVEVSELKHVRKAYKSLCDAYFSVYLRMFEYRQRLDSQETLISRREEFFKSMLGSADFQQSVMESLRKLERNIRECHRVHGQGIAGEKDRKDDDSEVCGDTQGKSKTRIITLTDISEWHRNLEDVRQCLGRMKTTLDEFKRLFDIAAFESKRTEAKTELSSKAEFYVQENAVLKNEISQLKKTLEHLMTEQSRDLTQRFPGPAPQEKEGVECRKSQNEIFRQELEINKRAYLQQLSASQEAAQKQMAQYEEYICKQNELLDRYRKLKEAYLAIRSRFQA